MVVDAAIGGGRGLLDVVFGAAPASTPCGSAVETGPVALVTLSVAGSATDVERSARVPATVAAEVEAALELVGSGVSSSPV